VVQIAGETLYVYFLGTAGALPTINRNPSCIMIRRGSDTLLFDCGEGAQQQMMRARTGFTVDAIFITHWHADHYLGVPGLLQTMSFMGRTEPLKMYGPRWIHEFVEYVEGISKNPLGFALQPYELSEGMTVPFDGYHVRAFASRHNTLGLGYILTEDERPGRFDREKAISLGVPPGPLFGCLQRGESVTIESGDGRTEIAPDQILGPPRPGRTVVYTGDTRPDSRGWAQYAMEADLLIHDATYDDSEAKRARDVYHSTAGEAGLVAREIQAHRLALVHISSRYTGTKTHIHDAKEQYEGEVIAPDDLEMIEITYRS